MAKKNMELEMNSLDAKEDVLSSVPQSDTRDQMVQFYTRAIEVRREYEDGWEKVTDKFVDAFETSTDLENFQVHSKLIYQAHNLIIRRMQRPDRKYLSDAASAEDAQLVRDAVNTVQDKGGYIDALMSDWGVYSRQVLIGNSPMMITSTGKADSPVQYTPLKTFGCYFDPFATTMRSRSGVNEVKEFLYIEEMSYNEAKMRYPDLEFAGGALPTGSQWDRNRDYTERQISEMKKRDCEIGHYFNIKSGEPIYEVFLGAQAVSGEKHVGKDYGYQIEGKDVIPVFLFKMFNSPKGLYGYGLQLLYDLCIVQERLRNLAFAHMGRNVNAISILNVARGTSGEFMNQMYNARELQLQGENGVILNETGDQGGMARMETLTSDSLTSEYERMGQEITLDIKRCGFPIDEVDRPVTETATATRAELGATTQFVQQIQEQNRDVYKDIELLTMDIMKKVSSKSTAPIITSLKNSEGVPVNAVEGAEPYTIGDAVDAMKEGTWTVMIDARSGAYKTDEERKQALFLANDVAQGGSKKINDAIFNILGVEADDIQETQSPEQEAGVPGEGQGVNPLPI